MCLLPEKGAYPENLHMFCVVWLKPALFLTYLCVLTLFQNAGSQFSKLFSLFMCVCVCVFVCVPHHVKVVCLKHRVKEH